MDGVALNSWPHISRAVLLEESKNRRHSRRAFKGSKQAGDGNIWNSCSPSGQAGKQRDCWHRELLVDSRPYSMALSPGWTPASGPSSLPSSTCSSPCDCPVPTCTGWANMCTSSSVTTWPGRPGPSLPGMPPPPRWGSQPLADGSQQAMPALLARK